LESDDEYDDKYVLSDNEQNKNEWKNEEKYHTEINKKIYIYYH